MTEDEAKTKACCGSPAITLGIHAATPPNPQRADGSLYNCQGSKCMAWRWSEPKRTAAFLEAVQAKMQTQDKPNFNTATQAVYAETGGKFERVEGFCGIAGQPS